MQIVGVQNESPTPNQRLMKTKVFLTNTHTTNFYVSFYRQSPDGVLDLLNFRKATH